MWSNTEKFPKNVILKISSWKMLVEVTLISGLFLGIISYFWLLMPGLLPHTGMENISQLCFQIDV